MSVDPETSHEFGGYYDMKYMVELLSDLLARVSQLDAKLDRVEREVAGMMIVPASSGFTSDPFWK